MAYNVLVTGAAGFLGSHLCKKLLQASCNVTAIDNLNNFIYSSSIKYKRLQHILNLNTDDLEKGNVIPANNIEFHKLDIDDAPAIRAMIIDGNFDCVIHLAGFSNSSISKQSSYAFLKNNVVGFFNIIDAIKEIDEEKRPNVILCSDPRIKNYLSFLVNGKEEEFKENKLNIYVATKLMEKVLANSYAETEGIKVSVLNIYSIYGGFDRPDMVVSSIFDSVLNSHALHLDHYHRGYDLLYIDDFVDIVSKIAISNINSQVENLKEYDIGSSKVIDINSLARVISAIVAGENVDNIEKEIVYKDEFNFRANLDKVKQDYGFEQKVSLVKGLQDYFNWLLKFKRDN